MPKAARRARAPVIFAAVEKSRPIDGVLAAAGFAGSQSLVHDPPDGAGTAPALRAATQAIVDLTGGARGGFRRRQSRAHIMVGEHVAGADNHCRKNPAANGCNRSHSLEGEF